MFKKRLFAKLKHKGGWFLVSAIIMILFLTAIGLSIGGLVATQYQHTKQEAFDQNAQLLAEAGVEQSVRQLNLSDTFAGYSTPQTFFDNAVQGKGTFTTTVTTNSDGTSKTIVSTGNVYRSDTATSPYLIRRVRVTVVGTTSSGYSVFTGPGGLILGGNATITNSAVFVNGTIQVNSGSAGIGTYNNPVDVNVANEACPVGGGATFPQVCNNGSQPITFNSSGNKSNIYGNVCATGQTTTGPNNNIQGGNGGQGLEVGCTASPASPPTYDRPSQISAVTTTASGSSGAYACTAHNKTFTWPANLKLTGDVSIGSGCKVTVTGNVWITGTLTVNGSSTIIVANSVGTNRPFIMVDGSVSGDKNPIISVGGSTSMAANASGMGLEFITFKSANSCTTSTSSYCSSITGTDLYNSQTQQTITVQSSANLAGMVFDSYWSEVNLAGSGILGAAAGQTVNLTGSGSVIFGVQLTSGSKTWSVTSYQQLTSNQ